MKRVLAIAVALGALVAAPAFSADELRGLWVDAWHAGFKTSAQVNQLLAECRAYNANAVFVQMRRRGDTYYPSPYEPWASDANPSFDALADIIQKAHGGSPRIEVHVWFVTCPIASDPPPSNPNHPYNKYPGYLMKDDAGNTNFDGYWFDPGHPEAEQYTYNVMMDVVNRYNVDGIHFDYIRYPGYHWGYNDVSVGRFNTIYGRTGQPLYTDDSWEQFRRDQVTALVRKVYLNTIAAKPAVKVSASTITWGSAPTGIGDWPSRLPYYQVFQDWRAWMQEGILDLNVPMDYKDCDDPAYLSWLNFAVNYRYNRAAATGVDICNKSHDCVVAQINATRVPGSYGFNGYSYDCGDLTAFHDACPTWENVPPMSWKTSPTKGHIKGTVTYGGLWIDNASVSLTGPAVRNTYTDGTGFYGFVDLPPGDYTVYVTKSGYGSQNKSATVTAGQVTTKDFDFNTEGITFSNVQAGSETASTVTITWTTNVPSTSQVYHGLDKNCTSSTVEDTNLVTNHAVVVPGLQAQTAYYYRAVSRNITTPLALSPVYACVTMPSFADIIIDNPSASFLPSEVSWSTVSGSAGYWGSDFRYVATATNPVCTATYTPTIAQAGDYKVSVYYPAGFNRSTQTPHTINYNGGSQTYNVSQAINGSQWNLLATKPFAVGTSGNLVISNSAPGGYYVNADATRFQFQPETTPPSVPTAPQASAISEERIDLTWTASTDNVAVAGYRVYRGSSVVGIAWTNAFSDTDLAGNTQYTYSVSAFDTSGNKSAASSSVSRYTLSVPPSPTTVTCNKPAGVWQTANPFTFTAVGGFGAGHLSYYRYAWDTSPTHTFDGSEFTWAASVRNMYAVTGPSPYYLHMQGWNNEGVPNGTFDYGPYYLDETAPTTPVVTDDGTETCSRTQVHAGWTTQDNDSGLAAMQYAVGTTSGATDVATWTDTANTSETITIPTQPVGTMLYVSVKARNGAGTWSSVGSSNGIRVGVTAASTSAAKAIADACAVVMDNMTVSAVYADCFYIADTTKPGGIRVQIASSGFAPGQVVNVKGTLATVDGERRIENATAQTPP